MMIVFLFFFFFLFLLFFCVLAQSQCIFVQWEQRLSPYFKGQHYLFEVVVVASRNKVMILATWKLPFYFLLF